MDNSRNKISIETEYHRLLEKFSIASKNFLFYRKQKDSRRAELYKEKMISAYKELSIFKSSIEFNKLNYNSSKNDNFILKK